MITIFLIYFLHSKKLIPYYQTIIIKFTFQLVETIYINGIDLMFVTCQDIGGKYLKYVLNYLKTNDSPV